MSEKKVQDVFNPQNKNKKSNGSPFLKSILITIVGFIITYIVLKTFEIILKTFEKSNADYSQMTEHIVLMGTTLSILIGFFIGYAKKTNDIKKLNFKKIKSNDYRVSNSLLDQRMKKELEEENRKKILKEYLEEENRKKILKEKLEKLEIDKDNRYIPSSVKEEVWNRDNGRCIYCGSTVKLEYDHIIPYSKGGTSKSSQNIQLLCLQCNRSKKDKII